MLDFVVEAYQAYAFWIVQDAALTLKSDVPVDMNATLSALFGVLSVMLSSMRFLRISSPG